MDEKCSNSTCGIVTSFLTGAMLGAGLVLLYAPQSGRKTRDDIVALSDDLLAKVREYGKEAQEQVKCAVAEGKELLAENKAILLAAIEAGKNAIKDGRQDIRSQ